MLISSIMSQSDVQLEVIHQISIMLMISLPVDHGSNKMSQVPGPAAATLKPVQFRNLLHRVKHRRLVGSCEWLIKNIHILFTMCACIITKFWIYFGKCNCNQWMISYVHESYWHCRPTMLVSQFQFDIHSRSQFFQPSFCNHIHSTKALNSEFHSSSYWYM